MLELEFHLDSRQIGQDQLKDKNYEFPKDVIPLGGRVEFFCHQDYRLDGDSTGQCAGGKVKTPRCQEGTPYQSVITVTRQYAILVHHFSDKAVRFTSQS